MDGEEQYSIKDETEEEVTSFVNDLPIDTFNEIRDFFDRMPVLEHEIEYTCAHCERDNRIKINGYEHFFG